jgi:flavin-dependent dehydrogenase
MEHGITHSSHAEPGPARSAAKVAVDAAFAAEESALEMERRAQAARRAADRARVHAMLARDAESKGHHIIAKTNAKDALLASQEAANAARVIF